MTIWLPTLRVFVRLQPLKQGNVISSIIEIHSTRA